MLSDGITIVIANVMNGGHFVLVSYWILNYKKKKKIAQTKRMNIINKHKARIQTSKTTKPFLDNRL
jgi:hypothetical protein